MKRQDEMQPKKEVVITEELLDARVVDYRVDGYSAGFIMVDAPEDLYVLRDAIEEYILANDIKPAKMR